MVGTRESSKGRLALAVVVVVLGALPAQAHGDAGQLTFADCLTTNTDVAACIATTGAAAGGNNTPLDTLYGTVASPDGTSVYSVGSFPETVTTFSRDPASGALAFAGCVSTSLAVCSEPPGFGSTSPLSGARAVAVSPDSRSVYTASQSGDAVAVFSRDPATGALTLNSCFTSNTDTTNCTQIPGSVAGGANTGLDTLDAVTVSPDGANVYTGSESSDAVATFTRDAATGSLTFGGCLTSNTSVSGCTPVSGAVANGTKTGLQDMVSLAVSPGGESLYAAAYNGYAVARFDRGAGGALTYRDCLSSRTDVVMCASLPGATANGDDSNLGNAMSVTVSADGRSVYVTGEYGASVTHFERDPATGALTQRDCHTANTNVAVCTPLPGAVAGANGTMLQYAEQVVASADGFSVYVASYDGALLRFASDPTTGALTFRDCFTGDTSLSGGCAAIPGATANGVNSPLQSAFSLALSPDDANLYVGAYAADAVVRFNREPPPSNEFTMGKLKRNKRKGTAKLTVVVPGPGALAVAGKFLRATGKQAAAAGQVKLLVAAKGKGKRKLRKRGKLKAQAAVTFTPTGGLANTEERRVKLIRKRRK